MSSNFPNVLQRNNTEFIMCPLGFRLYISVSLAEGDCLYRILSNSQVMISSDFRVCEQNIKKSLVVNFKYRFISYRIKTVNTELSKITKITILQFNLNRLIFKNVLNHTKIRNKYFY